MRAAVRQIPTTKSNVYAFNISGEVTSEGMSYMANIMNNAFSRYDEVDMLLIFEAYDGQEFGASLDTDVIKAQVRSLSAVNKYAVVGAPDCVAKIIDLMSKVIPVEAQTFGPQEEDKAWEFLGARRGLKAARSGPWV